jgi:hypothetical protein
LKSEFSQPADQSPADISARADTSAEFLSPQSLRPASAILQPVRLRALRSIFNLRLALARRLPLSFHETANLK